MLDVAGTPCPPHRPTMGAAHARRPSPFRRPDGGEDAVAELVARAAAAPPPPSPLSPPSPSPTPPSPGSVKRAAAKGIGARARKRAVGLRPAAGSAEEKAKETAAAGASEVAWAAAAAASPRSKQGAAEKAAAAAAATRAHKFNWITLPASPQAHASSVERTSARSGRGSGGGLPRAGADSADRRGPAQRRQQGEEGRANRRSPPSPPASMVRDAEHRRVKGVGRVASPKLRHGPGGVTKDPKKKQKRKSAPEARRPGGKFAAGAEFDAHNRDGTLDKHVHSVGKFYRTPVFPSAYLNRVHSEAAEQTRKLRRRTTERKHKTEALDTADDVRSLVDFIQDAKKHGTLPRMRRAVPSFARIPLGSSTACGAPNFSLTPTREPHPGGQSTESVPSAFALPGEEGTSSLKAGSGSAVKTGESRAVIELDASPKNTRANEGIDLTLPLSGTSSRKQSVDPTGKRRGDLSLCAASRTNSSIKAGKPTPAFDLASPGAYVKSTGNVGEAVQKVGEAFEKACEAVRETCEAGPEAVARSGASRASSLCSRDGSQDVGDTSSVLKVERSDRNHGNDEKPHRMESDEREAVLSLQSQAADELASDFFSTSAGCRGKIDETVGAPVSDARVKVEVSTEVKASKKRKQTGHDPSFRSHSVDKAPASLKRSSQRVKRSQCARRSRAASRPEMIDLTQDSDGEDFGQGNLTTADARSAVFKEEQVVKPPGGVPHACGPIDTSYREPPMLAELTEEERERANGLMLGKKSTWEEELATNPVANITLRRLDFIRLRGARWLNDEVLNSYVAMINMRNGLHDERAEEMGCKRTYPRTYMFNTYFHTRLVSTGYDYAGVRRWTRRAKMNVLDQDLILVPVNLGNSHWVLAGIDIRFRCFLYLDSMHGKRNEVVNALKQWLNDEVKDKQGIAAAANIAVDAWEVRWNKYNYAVPSSAGVQKESGNDFPRGHKTLRIPRQSDGGSCGVFTAKIADCLAMGRTVHFGQEHITLVRRRMALDLYHRALPG